MKHSIRLTAVAALVAASAIGVARGSARSTSHLPAVQRVQRCAVGHHARCNRDVNCVNGSFTPSQFVSVTVEGSATRPSGSSVRRHVFGQHDSDLRWRNVRADRLPSDASGNYNIAATSETSAGGTGTVSVGCDRVAADPEACPATGIDSSSLLGLWVGGGALVLAGGAVALTAAARRNHKEHAGV